ncbi:MAG: hypothetical protein KAV87_28765 [Desulfobacteraceae bacterium]|nr:hypothetical protein [Desulfobacteraceae bacterium]
MNGQDNMDTGLRWAVIVALVFFLGPIVWPIIAFIGWCLATLFGIAIAFGLIACAIYLLGLGINKGTKWYHKQEVSTCNLSSSPDNTESTKDPSN